MPKGLHALPEVQRAPDLVRLSARIELVRHSGSRSFYEGIERVEPGQRVVVTSEGIQFLRHWQPRRRILRFKKPEDYEEALREALDRAVAARMRGAGDVGTHLSGGLDSTSVTATAARLQAQRHRRVTAFTSAPRAGYAVPYMKHRFGDESGHAAAVATLYDNIEHVVLRSDGRSPFENLDSDFHFYDKPLLNPCNAVWVRAIHSAARARGLRVMLVGETGNATISYQGIELFAELFASGRIVRWWREALALRRRGLATWLGLFNGTFGHWLPPRLAARLRSHRRGHPSAAMKRAPIPARQDKQLERRRIAANTLPADAWGFRMDWLRHIDPGNEYLGILAESGIDRRDPTSDRRVVEFCLSVPTDEFLRDGIRSSLLRRAMRDRLPAMVLEEHRKGLQAVDWHESATRHHAALLAEIDALDDCQPVAERLDLRRLRAIAEDWPADGWERPETDHLYRNILLRNVSIGHFAREALAGRRH
jgi:asparagine synthase (glutamine-hydrolysing)